MKFINFFLLILITLLFSSCSENHKNVIFSEEVIYLKEVVNEKGKDIIWTEELEKEILTSDISKFSNVHKDVNLNREIFNIISSAEAVYPYINDFASLEDSLYTSELLSFIDSFNKDLSELDFKALEGKFNKEYFFNLVFFKNDLEKFILNNFDLDIYSTDFKILDILIGSDFISTEFFYVPIRFYISQGFFDLALYIQYDSGYYIKEIDIINWRKSNAE